MAAVISAPMPLEAPVTSTVLPVRSVIVLGPRSPLRLRGDCGSGGEALSELVELLHQRRDPAHALLALGTEALEGRERRAHVSDRVAGNGGERLRVALVAVRRVAGR